MPRAPKGKMSVKRFLATCAKSAPPKQLTWEQCQMMSGLFEPADPEASSGERTFFDMAREFLMQAFEMREARRKRAKRSRKAVKS